MALGTVQVNNLNQGNGEIEAIERHFLFIGAAGNVSEESQLFSVGAQTDLSETFADSALRDQLIAAQLNAGQNWTAAVYPLATGEELADAIAAANAVQSFEIIVFCDEQTTQTEIEDTHAEMFALRASHGRFVSALIATPGIDAETQTWSQFEAAAAALQNGIAAHLVTLVPQLHGNNIGVLAGRLCNRSVSIADSPMRTATGAILGLGEAPIDSADAALTLATLNTLSNNRFSVPQWYADYDGVYWGDAQTLDTNGGDFQYLEDVRIVHKGSREVRILAIKKVADRALNSSANSTEYHKSYFLKPLRAMSKSTTVNGVPFPGEVKPPVEGDVTIVWENTTDIVIYLIVRTIESAKNITVNILLDKSITE